MLEALLTLSSQKETCNSVASSPLCLSLLRGYPDTARFLLSQNADPHGKFYMTPLHAAARMGYQDMVIDFVTKFKISADCTDIQGATPAIYALYLPEREAIGMINILFRHGASPTTTFTENAMTYECYAAAMDKPNVVSWLKKQRMNAFPSWGNAGRA